MTLRPCYDFGAQLGAHLTACPDAKPLGARKVNPVPPSPPRWMQHRSMARDAVDRATAGG